MLSKPAALGVDVARQHFAHRFGRVEPGSPARAIEFVADILKPSHLAIGGIQERRAIAVEIEGAPVDALRVPFGLSQDVLRSQGDLLGLDDAHKPPVHDERVIGRAICGRKLLDRGLAIVSE